jgi:hypothetical protein
MNPFKIWQSWYQNNIQNKKEKDELLISSREILGKTHVIFRLVNTKDSLIQELSISKDSANITIHATMPDTSSFKETPLDLKSAIQKVNELIGD